MVMDIPQKEPVFKLPAKADIEHCPLCKNKWQMIEEDGDIGKLYFACLRQKCMISIWARDPLIGKYYTTESENCPVCKNEIMRLFYRSDGYIKMVCGKCGCMVESVDNEKHEKLIRAEEKAGQRKIFRAPPPLDQI